MSTHASFSVLGWREWVGLPALGLGAVLAKVDTGARSCALHVDGQQCFHDANGIEHVMFSLRPGEGSEVVQCRAPVLDRRLVTDSGGRRTERVFIRTLLQLGAWQREVEVNLADRRGLRHPMLVGRTALSGAWVVDPMSKFMLRPGPDVS